MRMHPLVLRRPVQAVLATIGVLLLFIILRGVFTGEPAKQATQATLPQVETLRIASGLQRSFTVTGEVEAEKSANFLADYNSTVDTINVRIGDTVKQGDQLLILRSDEVSQDFNTANSVYINTAQGLQQTRIQANQMVSESQIALKTAQINLEKLQKENLAKTVQAQESLKAAKLNFGLSEATAQTTLENSIRKTETVVRNALTYADDLLEFSPVQEGLTYIKETHLGVRDPAQKLKTQDALLVAYQSLQARKPTYKDSLQLLQSAETAMSMLNTVLFNSVTSPLYTQDTLNTNIDTVSGHLSSIRNQISDLETAKRTLDSTMQKTGNTSQVIIDAEATYATTMAQLEASLKKAELDVERAKSALNSAIASARSQEISAMSNVTNARGSLEMARISSDKLAIIAPFDGIVTDIPVRLGREIQPGELVLAMEDATKLKVVTFVSALEVQGLTTSARVEIQGGHLARLLSVAPSADSQTKKYKVEVELLTDALQPGELVSVTFVTNEDAKADERIFLPVTAVHVSAADTFVWVLQEDGNAEVSSETQFTAHKKSVHLGELAGKYIEITTGLTEGDTVILQGGRALSRDGQSVRPIDS